MYSNVWLIQSFLQVPNFQQGDLRFEVQARTGSALTTAREASAFSAPE